MPKPDIGFVRYGKLERINQVYRAGNLPNIFVRQGVLIPRRETVRAGGQGREEEYYQPPPSPE